MMKWSFVAAALGVFVLGFAGRAAAIVFTTTDLNPSGFFTSEAWGISGGQQTGWGRTTGSVADHALLWAGTAASVVDLHPSGFDSSVAIGTSGGQQVGYGNPAGNVLRHALLWTGTAASAVDLQPSGFVTSVAFGVSGGQQVGGGGT